MEGCAQGHSTQLCSLCIVLKGPLGLVNGDWNPSRVSWLRDGYPSRSSTNVLCKLPEALQGQCWIKKGQTQGLGKAYNILKLLCCSEPRHYAPCRNYILRRLPENLQMHAFSSCEKRAASVVEGRILPSRDMWQSLEVFLIVTTGG